MCLGIFRGLCSLKVACSVRAQCKDPPKDKGTGRCLSRESLCFICAVFVALHRSFFFGMSGPPKPKSIAVVGSCFIDEACFVPHMPQQGETLLCNSYKKGFGGKGGNQCVMVGKLGGDVRMVAMVGEDANGSAYVTNFADHKVDTRFVLRSQLPTGLAQIWVDEAIGDNRIVVYEGAAGQLNVDAANNLLKDGCLDGMRPAVQERRCFVTRLHWISSAFVLYTPFPPNKKSPLCYSDMPSSWLLTAAFMHLE